MKKILSILTVALLGAVTVSNWSCKEDPKPQGGGDALAKVTKMEAGDPDYLATSAGFEIETAQIDSYAFSVVEGENQPAPDPAILYAEAKEKTEIKDGKNTKFVYGLQADKKYTVHFVFKVKGSNTYIGHSVSTATKSYDRLINVIKADRMEFSVQFNAAPDQEYYYLILPSSQYNDENHKKQGDGDRLKNGGVRAKGPQVITIKDGVDNRVVKPGDSYTALFAECDAAGNIEVKKVTFPETNSPSNISSIKPNSGGYVEATDDDWYSFVNDFARLSIWTAPPIKGAGEFKIERQLTEMNAYFRITPPSSVIKYGAVVVSEYAWKHELIPAVGEAGAISYAHANWTKALIGVQTIASTEILQKDSTYKLIVVGICEDSGETQVQYIEDFKPIVSTKPIVEIILTSIEDENKSPYAVHFNIKAPNKDLYSGKFLMNYKKDWLKALNSGRTEYNMINGSGNKFTKEQVDQINTEAGLTLDFTSIEDIENRLVVGAYNTDDRLSIFRAEVRSLPEPAKPRIESDLFTTLLGDWEVTYNYLDMNGTESTAKFPTKITNTPEPVPANFKPGDKGRYDALNVYFVAEGIRKEVENPTQYATDKINALIADYEGVIARHAKKYRDQNRIVMTGFGYSKFNGLAFLSSFDLFADLNFSAYDSEELIYSYGPKMFFEISKNEKGEEVINLETNPQFIAPLSAYDHMYTIMVGGLRDKKELYFGQFPIEVVNQDSLVINKSCGSYYDFAILTQNQNGGMGYTTYAKSDITLSRIKNAKTNAPWVAPSNGATTKSPIFYQMPGVTNKARRTVLPISAKSKVVANDEVFIPTATVEVINSISRK